MKRTRFEAIDKSEVIRHRPDGSHEVYWRPWSGGYVRLITPERPGILGLQVCDYLALHGSTLWCSCDKPLIEIIRREYRRNRHDA